MYGQGSLLAGESSLISSCHLISSVAAPQIPPLQQQKAPAPPPPSGPRYVAVYDYTATYDDEISFHDHSKVSLSPPQSYKIYRAYRPKQ